MRKFIISAGHTPTGFEKDPGAVNNKLKLTEADLAEDLANRVVAIMRNSGATVHKDVSNLRLSGVLNWARRLVSGRDIAVDIHFNAASATSTGCEVLRPSTGTMVESQLATSLAAGISTVLGIRNRGVKTELDSARKQLGWFTLNCETVLIEVCFISNDLEISNYLKKVEEVAGVIAKTLISYNK